MANLSFLYTLPGLEIYLAIIGILLYAILMIKKTPKEERNKPTIIFIFLTGMMAATGLLAILYGLLELIGSKESAKSLGREASPYQLQLALAEIGAGIVGSSTLLKPDFMVPAMITKISLTLGLAYSICVEFIRDGSKPDSEIALQLVWSLLFPVIVLVLFVAIKLLKVKKNANEIKQRVSVGQNTPMSTADADVDLDIGKDKEVEPLAVISEN
eukprot:194037_1